MAETNGVDVDVKGLKESHIPGNFKGEGHAVAFDIDGVPEKLYVGDPCSLVLFAACESGCDLVGDVVKILDFEDNVIAASQFATQEGELAVSEAIELTMPDAPGKYQFIVRYEPRELPMPEDGGPAFKNPHEEVELLIEFTVEAHHVTVSTWGVTAPVWVGEPIKFSVGASCSSGCSLDGQEVHVFDENDKLIASGKLHEPQEPRKTLWWDELSAVAPEEAKLHRWEVRFSPTGLARPHDEAKHKFSFVARIKPERTFKITVIDDKTDKPQRSARVELKPAEGNGKAQFATTGAEGRAEIGCSKEKFALKVTAPSRKTFNETVDLTEGDVEVEVHLQPTSGASGDPKPMVIVSGPGAAPVAEQAAAEAEQVVEQAAAEAEQVVEQAAAEVEQVVEDAVADAREAVEAAVEHVAEDAE